VLSGHREVLPQPVQQRETLGGEVGPLERRGVVSAEQRLYSFSWKLLLRKEGGVFLMVSKVINFH